MRSTKWLLPVLLAAALLPAQAQQQDDPSAALKAQLERIRQLRQQRPGDGLLVFYQAMTHAQLGERDAVLAELGSLSGRRLGLVPTPVFGFDRVWDDPEFQALRRKLLEEEPRTADAPVALRLPDARLIPEGIAYDAKTRRVFVGSIAQHKIVVADAKGRVRDFSRAADGLDAVLGLAVAPGGDRLCAVSTNAFEDSAKQGKRNAVLCYSLKTGRLLVRLEAPDAAQLNDLAIARDGTLYVTDSQASGLFKAGPGDRTLQRLGAAGAVRGANGIALAPDGTLYVSLSTGIARVDATSGEAQRLPQPDDVALGGMDGLYWHDGALVGIQNVTNPGRVVRVALSEDGRRITGAKVLQSHHHPAFEEPTTGAIVGDKLYVIANSHVGRHHPDGTLKDPQTLKPTAVIAVPLRG